MKYERLKAEEIERIMNEVNASHVPVSEALKCLGIPRSTYYNWVRKKGGKQKKNNPGKVWNKLLKIEVDEIINQAHEMPDLTARELAHTITDMGKFSVSESSVYRVLKKEGLIKEAKIIAAKAAKEYHTKTTRVNEMWATDFMHIKVTGWGWYYAAGVLDDKSRALLYLKKHKDMEGGSCSDILQECIERMGIHRIPPEKRELKLLSDNGSGYISEKFNAYLRVHGIRHILTAPHHPQSNGKMERLNRTAKSRLCQTVIRSPEELDEMLEDFRYWYNYVHCHEALNNLRPADVYNGRGDEMLKARRLLKVNTFNRRRILNTMEGMSAPSENLNLSKYR